MRIAPQALAEGSLPLLRRPDFRKFLHLHVLGAGGCPICRNVAWLDDRYFSRFQRENFALAKTWNGLTRSLGFCAADGARTVAHPSGQPAVATVHEVLTRRVGKILSRVVSTRRKGSGGGPILAEHDRCPACRSRDDVTGRAASFLATALNDPEALRQYEGLRSVCFPHVQAMARYCGGSILQYVLGVHKIAVDSAAESVAAFDREHGADRNADEENMVGALLKALPLTAGCNRTYDLFEPPLADKPSPTSRGPVENLVEAMSRNDGCAVCIEMDRTWVERMKWLCGKISEGCEFDELLPVCPQHLWAAVCDGPPLLVVASVRNALRIIAGQIRTALDTLAPSSSPARRGMMPRIREAIQGSHRRLGEARDVIGRPLPCPACTLLQAARDRTLMLLSALLKDSLRRNAFERGYGLCLKHYSRALALNPSPEMHAFLTEVEAGKLALLRWELEESSRKSPWSSRPESSGTENTAWKRAVARFSGSFVWSPE